MVEERNGGISRRDFIKGSGLVVGGAAITSTGLIVACSPAVQPGPTANETGTGTTKFICPYDNKEFASLAELKTHLSTVHGGEAPVTTIAGLTKLNVNGNDWFVKVEPEWSLAFVLREKLGLVGLKVGCDRGECGSCNILVGGKLHLACTMIAVESEGLTITTIEGLADGTKLHPVQQLFLDNQTFQCGYCTNGMIMAAVALLTKTPRPSLTQVREAIAGNLCWCGDYVRQVNTILKGAG